MSINSQTKIQTDLLFLFSLSIRRFWRFISAGDNVSFCSLIGASDRTSLGNSGKMNQEANT